MWTKEKADSAMLYHLMAIQQEMGDYKHS